MGFTANETLERFSALIDLAVAEAGERKAGRRSVLLRVGELLFVEVVRRHLSSAAGHEGGWLAGLRDPIVGLALARLHEKPAHAWTLDELAREAGASRSVLTERFSDLVGQPPMHCVQPRVQERHRPGPGRVAKPFRQLTIHVFIRLRRGVPHAA